jgi:hypothetical protein
VIGYYVPGQFTAKGFRFLGTINITSLQEFSCYFDARNSQGNYLNQTMIAGIPITPKWHISKIAPCYHLKTKEPHGREG